MTTDNIQRGDQAPDQVSASSGEMNEGSSVKSLFSGSCIFLTGATGSVGSVLLEKLLRSCPEIDKIYVLLRPKSNLDIQQRLKKLFNLPLFSLVPPSNFSRVIALEGDVGQDNLGLSETSRTILLENVSLVFHCAANVAFNAGIRSAVTANLLGTKKIMQLCHDMKKLKSLVYVSTAYANCPLREATERLYPVTCDPNKVIELVQNSTDQELKLKTRELLGAHPNFYTLTKQLAEHLLATERKHVPLAIVRPSIVLGTWKEPFPGWLQVGPGAAGFMAGASKGVFRTSQAAPGKIADIVPADLVVNAIITVAWSLAQPSADTLQIYHVTSGTRNPVTWGEYTDMVMNATREYPCSQLAWLPGATCRPELWRNKLAVRIFQTWPSHLVDLIENRTSASHNKHKRESLVSVQKRFLRGMEVTHYFSKRQWSFHSDNLTCLGRRLSPEDKSNFPTELVDMDWSRYLASCVLGVRTHYFRDPPATLNKARAHLQRWKVAHIIAQIALIFIIYSALGSVFDGTMLLLLTAFCTFILIWI